MNPNEPTNQTFYRAIDPPGLVRRSSRLPREAKRLTALHVPGVEPLPRRRPRRRRATLRLGRRGTQARSAMSLVRALAALSPQRSVHHHGLHPPRPAPADSALVRRRRPPLLLRHRPPPGIHLTGGRAARHHAALRADRGMVDRRRVAAPLRL